MTTPRRVAASATASMPTLELKESHASVASVYFLYLIGNGGFMALWRHQTPSFAPLALAPSVQCRDRLVRTPFGLLTRHLVTGISAYWRDTARGVSDCGETV